MNIFLKFHSKLSEGGKTNRVLLLFMILVCVVGIFNAFRFGAANLDYYSVRNSIDLWSENGQTQTKEEYESAKRAIKTARILHSSNPLYIELTGQITEWGQVSGLDADKSLLDAKADYLKATTLRPMWPVSWANLAMLKWRLQEFDDEMLGYLEKANELGPQSREVHLLYSQLGLTLYKANHPFYININKVARERVVLVLKTHSSRDQFRDFINANGHLVTVCRWVKIDAPAVAKNFLSCKS
ncbi:VpsP family polysaccharide biosynthesis protein [Glaciecola petra]|uniref:VpsP family polysaccharide biosynthesis protein n=1 Tax=Glaciecola petra TaxID=3075602 RepID=A0ABU2ZX07_9ALTE|nr:VpsP family polysaccharide biosynthesis protein [Aestuariibacter sp. P117]MDT0595957.1 VpsP family polysaccharide biosynthesis protein [Aestuariibacter sp. P117]